MIDLCGGSGSVALAAAANRRKAVYVEKNKNQFDMFNLRLDDLQRSSSNVSSKTVWLPKALVVMHADDFKNYTGGKLTESSCRYFPGTLLLKKHSSTTPADLPWLAFGLSPDTLQGCSRAIDQAFRNMEGFKVRVNFFNAKVIRS